MTILEDFNKMHNSTKNVSVGIVLSAPFWFMDIYLFKYVFFISAPIYIPIVISFCLTVALLFLYTLAVILMKTKNAMVDYISSNSFQFQVASIFSVGTMSALSSAVYFCKGNFNDLLVFVFGLPSILILILTFFPKLFGNKNIEKFAETYNDSTNNK